MSDKENAPNKNKGKTDKEAEVGSGWSTGAKVGAAVGSAALLGALLYAGSRAMRKAVEPDAADDQDSPKAPTPPPGEQFESD